MCLWAGSRSNFCPRVAAASHRFYPLWNYWVIFILYYSLDQSKIDTPASCGRRLQAYKTILFCPSLEMLIILQTKKLQRPAWLRRRVKASLAHVGISIIYFGWGGSKQTHRALPPDQSNIQDRPNGLGVCVCVNGADFGAHPYNLNACCLLGNERRRKWCTSYSG